MTTITLTDDKLNEMLDTIAHKAASDTVFEILRNKDALSNLVEMMEDIGLGKMMEEAENDESVSEEKVMAKLKKISEGGL